MDHLYTLNESTPKIKCVAQTGVDPSLIFGLDTKLFMPNQLHSLNHSHDAKHGHDHELDSLHHNEVETATIRLESRGTAASPKPSLTRGTLEEALTMLPKASVYRVKGFIIFTCAPESPNPIHTPTSVAEEAFILNWAFGRFELVPFKPSTNPGVALNWDIIRLTIMGERGEVKAKWAGRLADALHAEVE
jgi:G3E family GTPase